jgi:hypothetical protein
MTDQTQIVLIAAGCTGAVGLAGTGVILLPRVRVVNAEGGCRFEVRLPACP